MSVNGYWKNQETATKRSHGKPLSIKEWISLSGINNSSIDWNNNTRVVLLAIMGLKINYLPRNKSTRPNRDTRNMMNNFIQGFLIQKATYDEKMKDQEETFRRKMNEQELKHKMELRRLLKMQMEHLGHVHQANCKHHSVLIAMNPQRFIPTNPADEILVRKMAQELQEIRDNDDGKDAEIARLRAELADRQEARCKHTDINDLKEQIEIRDHIINRLIDQQIVNDRRLDKMDEQNAIANCNIEELKEDLVILDSEYQSLEGKIDFQDVQLAALRNEKEELENKLEEKEQLLQNMGMQSPDTSLPETEDDRPRSWEGGYVESHQWASLFTYLSL
jgi:hypothetical protein